MELLPLKLYGTVRNRPRVKKWVLRIKGQTYEYCYTESNKNEIYDEVCQLQKEKTVELYSDQINLYKHEIGYISVQTNVGIIKVDLEDLQKIAGYYWSRQEGRKHLTSNVEKIRTSLVVHLYGSPIQQKDPLDFRRTNIKDSINVNLNMDIDRYLFEDGPHIPKQIWSKIRNSDDFEYISHQFSKALLKKYPKPPMPVITDQELFDDLLMLECDNSSDFKSNRSGYLLAKKFVLHLILDVKVAPYLTLYEVWKDEAILTQVIQKYHNFSKALCNFNSKYIIRMHNIVHQQGSNFPPVIAKQLYNFYKPRVVLDLCSGFGGRFTGFWFSEVGETYIGLDPNQKLKEPHQLMTQYLTNHFPNNKTIHIIYETAEDRDYPDIIKNLPIEVKDNLVDLIFTSPPYFTKEIYSDDPTQSTNRYVKFESWYNYFLLKMLRISSLVLRTNGVLCLNYKDCKDYPVFERLVNDLDHIYSYIGSIPISFPSRPCQQNTDILNQEPIHIFWKK